MSDYRILIRVQNARIKRAMESAGVPTVSELARRAGIAPTDIGKLVNLKRPARGVKGEWCKAALKIAEVLNCFPEDLFTPRQQLENLTRTVTHRDVSEDAISSFLIQGPQAVDDPLKIIDARAETETLYEALTRLPPRLERVIRERYGFGTTEEKSLDEVGKMMGVTRERIRQMEKKAFRILKGRLNREQFATLLARAFE